MGDNGLDVSKETEETEEASHIVPLKRKCQSSVATPEISTIPLYPHPLEPTVSFHIGKKIRQTPQSVFLSYIWGTGLDSNCMSCNQPFHPSSEPIIRTIGLERAGISKPFLIDITQEPISPYSLRIFNRNFSCIKAKKISYIPISHAWHGEVAAAQDFKVESIGVSRLVYQTPVKTLLALVAKYPDAEIWHDYLSVPQ